MPVPHDAPLGFATVSHLLLVRLLVAITVIMWSMNVLFVSPLEDWSLESSYLSSSSSPLLSTSTVNQSFAAESRYSVPFPSLSESGGRQHILDLFQEAGVTLTPEMEAQLPTWSQVQQVIGPHPYVLGLEHCQKYRDIVPPLERMLGSSGMFNTGTNLVTHLLKQNCEIPERRQKMGPHQSKESYGMRWQVPWGKHTPAKFRLEHATTKAQKINKDWILPVVTIRNPYTWFVSMCNNGYTAKWKHGKQIPHCPSLKDPISGDWHNVTVKFADNREDRHTSLAHLWNDWYSYYIRDADFPFVVVRMEDLVFYPKETTRAVCECAGGVIRDDQAFQFIVDSAKADSPGHDKSTGIYAAWVKYSKLPLPQAGFTDLDYQTARHVLDGEMMKNLGYRHPPSD